MIYKTTTLRRLLIALSCVIPVMSNAQVDARMLRQPAVSATQIAFVYGGDIWIMPKSGGTAQRLTSALGEESFPRFSPDGSRIAFTGNYDGNEDVYVMPARGGTAQRLTFHPGTDRMVDWFPDGKSILFATPRASRLAKLDRLFRISADGGAPTALPMPYGQFGAISPDGQTLAYLPTWVDFRTWKRYRGGWLSDIWFYNLKTGSARHVVPANANNSEPMWHGTTMYFLSDRGTNERGNIWAYDTKTDSIRQVTFFNDFDIKYPSIGPSDIVFQKGSRMYLLDLATEKTHEIPVTVVTDRATLRARAVNVGRSIVSATISPTGKRALFEARGEVFTMPAEEGFVRDLTNTSDAAERSPEWSPDGKSVAYFSDRSGEYELTVRNADGAGAEHVLTRLGPGFRYHPWWSPDSKQLAFIDQVQKIQIYDMTTGKVIQVDTALQYTEGTLRAFRASWSPDSRWIAYARDTDNQNDAIFLFDTHAGKRYQVTSGYFNDKQPVFDPDGKYLYFLSGRTLEPVYSDVDRTWIYPNSTNVVAVPLRRDVVSPLAPRNNEEPSAADVTAPGAKKVDSTQRAARETIAAARNVSKAPPTNVDIDIDGFERRIVVLPPDAGNYDDLQAVSGKVLYSRRPRTGSSDSTSTVAYFDLNDRDEKTIVKNVRLFVVSADGKKMLVQKGRNDYYIIDVKPEQKLEKKLATAQMESTVDPVAEWHQIFNDAWRIERDFFYDPGMHGVDWNAIHREYGKLIDDATTRWDVSFVLAEMVSELNSSHTYNRGGDLQVAPSRDVGLLGADYTLENGAYRITRILDGGAWDSEVRSPLLAPGLNIREGMYLLAVNGTPLDTTRGPYAAFQGLANQTVSIAVNDRPQLAGSRVVLVKTLDDESRLRTLAWVESNRRRVDEATHGRVGYVYVPNTGIDGQTDLVRQFRAQFNKDGLVIDDRFNGGGQVPDRFIELLNRPTLNFWKTRTGTFQTPAIAHPGPQVMLINGMSGSGGDAFPYYFKEVGLGPLIGQRTWGGLIGYSGTPPLVDGGSVTAPSFAIYDTTGKWIIEGHGVDPDIPVVDDPAQLSRGVDPQLERAIQEVMREVEKRPKPVPPPPYTKRTAPAPGR